MNQETRITEQSIDKTNIQDDNEQQSDNEISSRPTRNPCDICKLNPYKYRCPGCSTQTCSLKCCNDHKKLQNCTGKYDNTKFIGINGMNEKILKKDLNFLSSVIENTETIKKRLSILKRSSEQLRFKLLKTYAKKLHGINLKLAPVIMSRHRDNLSFYHTRSKKIYWSVEFLFYLPPLENQHITNISGQNTSNGEHNPLLDNNNNINAISNDTTEHYLRIKSRPVDETLFLSDILVGCTSNTMTKLNVFLVNKYGKFDILDLIKQNLLKCYMKLEDDPKEKKVVQVDWFTEMSIFLKKNTIIEYPTFIISFANDLTIWNVYKLYV